MAIEVRTARPAHMKMKSRAISICRSDDRMLMIRSGEVSGSLSPCECTYCVSFRYILTGRRFRNESVCLWHSNRASCANAGLRKSAGRDD